MFLINNMYHNCVVATKVSTKPIVAPATVSSHRTGVSFDVRNVRTTSTCKKLKNVK